MAYIEFKTEAEANKALEEKQGTEIDGRAMVIDFTGEKSHQDHQKGTFPNQKCSYVWHLGFNFTCLKKFARIEQLEALQENCKIAGRDLLPVLYSASCLCCMF